MSFWSALKGIGKAVSAVGSVVPGPWQPLAIGAGTLLSGMSGSGAARKSSRQLVDATKQARGYREAALGRAMGILSPYEQAGRTALPALTRLAGRAGPVSHSFLRAVPGQAPQPTFDQQGMPVGAQAGGPPMMRPPLPPRGPMMRPPLPPRGPMMPPEIGRRGGY